MWEARKRCCTRRGYRARARGCGSELTWASPLRGTPALCWVSVDALPPSPTRCHLRGMESYCHATLLQHTLPQARRRNGVNDRMFNGEGGTSTNISSSHMRERERTGSNPPPVAPHLQDANRYRRLCSHDAAQICRSSPDTRGSRRCSHCTPRPLASHPCSSCPLVGGWERWSTLRQAWRNRLLPGGPREVRQVQPRLSRPSKQASKSADTPPSPPAFDLLSPGRII